MYAYPDYQFLKEHGMNCDKEMVKTCTHNTMFRPHSLFRGVCACSMSAGNNYIDWGRKILEALCIYTVKIILSVRVLMMSSLVVCVVMV